MFPEFSSCERLYIPYTTSSFIEQISKLACTKCEGGFIGNSRQEMNSLLSADLVATYIDCKSCGTTHYIEMEVDFDSIGASEDFSVDDLKI